MKLILTSSLLLAPLAFSNPYEDRSVTLHFSDSEAKKVGQALGLEDSLYKVANLAIMNQFFIDADVRGHTSKGEPVYRYSAKATLVTTNLQKAQGHFQVSYAAQAAGKLYSALKGIQAKKIKVAGTDAFTKTLSTSEMLIDCAYTPQGFNPYSCTITVKDSEG